MAHPWKLHRPSDGFVQVQQSFGENRFWLSLGRLKLNRRVERNRNVRDDIEMFGHTAVGRGLKQNLTAGEPTCRVQLQRQVVHSSGVNCFVCWPRLVKSPI